MGSARAGELEAVARHVVDRFEADELVQLSEIATTHDGDGDPFRKHRQRLAGLAVEQRLVRVRHDRGQGAIVVEKHGRLGGAYPGRDLGPVFLYRRHILDGPRLESPVVAQPELAGVRDDQAGAIGSERLGVVATVDADDEAEAAAHSRLHARHRVLDDGGLARSDAQLLRERDQHGRVGLSRQGEAGEIGAVKPGIEHVQNPGALQYLAGVSTGGEYAQLYPAITHAFEQGQGAGIGAHRMTLQPFSKEVILAISQSAHGFPIRCIVGAAEGQLDAA